MRIGVGGEGFGDRQGHSCNNTIRARFRCHPKNKAMSNAPIHLDQNSQTRTALATTLGVLTMLVEELAHTRAVDANRLMERFDQFVLSASVASGTATGEAQYVAQLIDMVKSGLTAGEKGQSDA